MVLYKYSLPQVRNPLGALAHPGVGVDRACEISAHDAEIVYRLLFSV